MTAINDKIDEILKTVTTLDRRMKQMEDKFKSFDRRIDSNATKIGEVQIEQLKLRQTISQIQDKLNELRQEKEEIRIETKRQNLSRELYSKRFNYLIHGIPESSENVWETRQQTEKLFRKFVAEGLQIQDSNSIKLADIHRLPQHPIYDSDKRKINRPIIVKFMDIFNKQNFVKNLKHLKEYNEKRPPTTKYVYATEHLPIELQRQKKKLIPLYKKAKEENKKTVLKIVDCEYCLFVDDVRVHAD